MLLSVLSSKYSSLLLFYWSQLTAVTVEACCHMTATTAQNAHNLQHVLT